MLRVRELCLCVYCVRVCVDVECVCVRERERAHTHNMCACPVYAVKRFRGLMFLFLLCFQYDIDFRMRDHLRQAAASA